MSYRTPSSLATDTTDAERRSGVVFSAFLAFAMLALAFPEMAPQALQGILWTGAGLVMVLFPPESRIPRSWWLLGCGFAAASAIGFLPRDWFHLTEWRQKLEDQGLDTGPYAFVQASLAIETLAGYIVTTIVALFLLGHRVGTRGHHQLLLAFVTGTGVLTAAAIALHKPGDVFGFFPNRNHTATLLAMGSCAGFGALAQAIRVRDAWRIALAAVPTLLCLYAIVVVCESRAGVLLLAVGSFLWLAATGFRLMGGHAGKALLLIAIALVGTFLTVDSRVKDRLKDTVEKIQQSADAPSPGQLSAGTSPGDMASPEVTEPPLDARLAIYKDTLQMIGHEPWSGVGPGQFSRVFPQYRRSSTASNDSICLHPESDWLLLLAENGGLATGWLLAVVAIVFITAGRRAWRGRARALRMGSLVAASLLCLHATFDVPAHRVGLAWSAILLVASALRTSFTQEGDEIPPFRSARWFWRSTGVLLALTGAALMVLQWRGDVALPSRQALAHLDRARLLHEQDQIAQKAAAAEGRDYQPAPQDDPLEAALAEIGRALRITPLDPHAHYLQGALALYFDDKQALAARSFAIQRILLPDRVLVPIDQARAWLVSNPNRSIELWQEAMQRATAAESKTMNQGLISRTFQTILKDSSQSPGTLPSLLPLAGSDPNLVRRWIAAVPTDLSDSALPGLLLQISDPSKRKEIFGIWSRRSKSPVPRNFASAHPEFELSDP
ncbi:O-antigen ligase family protein [Luteolibacter marinus]|uniref:O-antigen ligase family protein n=1 Tax=Luteolibacter marinus TaxID=2776705 RepID=UPI001867CB32|nr:O-antigen ligase family protein [Luteolibacter marinus]